MNKKDEKHSIIVCIVYCIYLKKIYVTCENMKKSCIIHCDNIKYNFFSRVQLDVRAFSVDFLDPTSDLQAPITFLLGDTNTSGYLFLNWTARKSLVLKLPSFAKNFTFSTPALG